MTRHSHSTLCMKFGGAAVAAPQNFSKIADIIINRMDSYDYEQIVVVVSAMGNTTDQLINLAKEVNPCPPKREYDMLVTVGERISIALLAMALAKKNKEAVSFTGSQSGIITCNNHSEAKIIDVRPHRILSAINQKKIAIVAGFQGVSKEGEITTLGRGGSDTTAVALGIALGAKRVEFFKDVPGIFNEDPKKNQLATKFDKLTYFEALSIVKNGAKILHPRCIELANKNKVLLHVCTFLDSGKQQGTLIGEERFDPLTQPLYENE